MVLPWQQGQEWPTPPAAGRIPPEAELRQGPCGALRRLPARPHGPSTPWPRPRDSLPGHGAGHVQVVQREAEVGRILRVDRCRHGCLPFAWGAADDATPAVSGVGRRAGRCRASAAPSDDSRPAASRPRSGPPRRGRIHLKSSVGGHCTTDKSPRTRSCRSSARRPACSGLKGVLEAPGRPWHLEPNALALGRGTIGRRPPVVSAGTECRTREDPSAGAGLAWRRELPDRRRPRNT